MKRLSLAGYGGTFEDARLSLRDSFESLIIGYLAFDDTNLSEKSRKIKKNLLSYVDLDEYGAQVGELKIESLIMPVKQREFSKAVLKKGFVSVKRDHCYFYLKDKNGKIMTEVRTKISQHGNLKEISDNMLSVMYKQTPF